MKQPIYIRLKDGKVYRTIHRDGFYEDVDMVGNTLGLEILNYKEIEQNGKVIRSKE